MLFKNKYRVESTRLKEWDYSTPWWYYVTIDTKYNVCCFGTIKKGVMLLNDFGKSVEEIWNSMPLHYIEVDLDFHVIMPNHIHGIIIINNVEMGHAPSLQQQTHSLSNIVGSFKSAVTKYAHESGVKNFSWQKGFYDRIIRNDRELYNVRKYIIDNPIKWYYEKCNPESIFKI